MKPSVQDATHYLENVDLWFKIGEQTIYFWDNGWFHSTNTRSDLMRSKFLITAQEALERGYKYPQYPTTTQGVIVDSTGSGEVLEASETRRKINEVLSQKWADDLNKQTNPPIYDLPDSNTTYRKTVDDLYEDHFDKVKKINEAISHHPYITHEQLELLRDNGYKVNSVGVFKGDVLQIKPSEQTVGFGPVYASAAELNKKWNGMTTAEVLDYTSNICKDMDKRVEDCHKGPYIFVNEPMIPDMTEANDKKVNTTSANNRQVGGDHYKKMKIQPWDLFGSIFNLDEQIGFYLGNVYKYLMRYDSKNGIQDLEKAKHYLEKLIEVKRGAASADVTDKH